MTADMNFVLRNGISGSGGMMGGGGGKKGGGESDENTRRTRANVATVEILSEGVIEGFIDANGNVLTGDISKAIYLDQTPIQNTDNNTYNFKNVSLESHVGLADEGHFKSATGVETPISVEVQVKKNTGPVTRTIVEENATAVRVIMRIPALVFRNEKDGSLKRTSVSYAIDVRQSGGSWVEVLTHTENNQKALSPFQIQHYVPLPEGGMPWDLRVRRLTDDPEEDSGLTNDTWWESYILLVEGKFTYPHTAGFALRANAEDMGSSLPVRTARIRGIRTKVPSNYDPYTRTYTGTWDGTFKISWHSNPAWVFYDLIENNRYGLGDLIDAASIDKWSLYTVARYCDQLVPSGFKDPEGNDILEPRFAYHHQITKRDEAYFVLQQISTIWRGMAYWSLGQVFATADMPQDPVKLVTPANVINGEFSYSGTGLKARHTVVMVRFNNKDDFYRPDTEVVIDDKALAKYGWRDKTLNLAGAVTRGQAHRYAKWILDTEHNATETITYAASWDHAELRPGDIIAVSNPKRQGVRLGGRVAESKTIERTAAELNFTTSDFMIMGQTKQASDLTIARASAGLAPNAAAELVNFVANALRLTDAGLLVEPEATNFFRPSNLNGSLTGNHVVTHNAAPGVPGLGNASRLARSTTSSSYMGRAAISVSGPNLRTTFSCYVKPETAAYFSLRLQGNYPGRADACFNLLTGAVVSKNVYGGYSAPEATITPAANGYFRVSLTATTDTASFIAFYAAARNTAGAIDSTDTSSSVSVLAQGFQAELGERVSSLIHTTTAAVTRPADLVKIPVPAGTYSVTFNTDAGSETRTITADETGLLIPTDLAGKQIKSMQVRAAADLGLTKRITLDHAFEPAESATYSLMVTLPDGTLETKPVERFAEQEAIMAEPFSTAPLPNAMYVITGTDITPVQYRVLAVEETEPNIFKITALIHDPTKYARVEQGIHFEPVPVYRDTSLVQPPTTGRVEETGYVLNGTTRLNLTVSWSPPPTSILWTGFDVYCVDPNGARVNLGPTNGTSVELRDVEDGEYTFYVATIGVTGKRSDPLEFTYEAIGAAGFAVPTVTDLKLKDNPASTTFAGTDLSVTWKNNFASSTIVTSTDGAPAHIASPHYAFNTVKVYAGATLLRTARVQGESYVYDIATNRADCLAQGLSTPARSLRVVVTVDDIFGRTSAAAETVFTNPQVAPLIPNIARSGNTLIFNLPAQVSGDFAGLIVWRSDEEGTINPATDTPYYDGPANPVIIEGEANANYWFVVAPYDTFGKDSLNYSSEFLVDTGSFVDQDAPAQPSGLTLSTELVVVDGVTTRMILRAEVTAAPEADFAYYDFDIKEEGGNYVSFASSSNVYEWPVLPELTYTVKVRAVDRSGNHSARTDAASILTPACPELATIINSGTVLLEANKIVVSGGTRLSDWRRGGDETKIDGGAISANTIDANKLTIGQRGVVLEGIEFEHNKPAQNQLSWTAGTISYVNDAGAAATANISAGSLSWTAGIVYVIWVKGATSLSSTTSFATAMASNTIVLATYRGGRDLIASYGRTVIDGASIKTGTIDTAQLKAGAVTADKMSVTSLAAISATLGNVVVDGALVVNGSLSGSALANLAVATGKIDTSAISVSFSGSGGAIYPHGGTHWVDMYSLNVPMTAGKFLNFWGYFTNQNINFLQFRILINGAEATSTYYLVPENGGSTPYELRMVAPAGNNSNVQIRFQARGGSSSYNNYGYAYITQGVTFVR